MNNKMPQRYDFLKEVRQSKLYKSNIGRRNKKARQILESNCEQIKRNRLVSGNLYMMKYIYPKTEEELEYWDTQPCSIVFGKFKTQEGEWRILTFALHYYPPRMRFQILNRVLEIYKGIYKNHWDEGLLRSMSAIDYKTLVDQLKKAKLTFGVREYIPKLISECYLVPPKYWAVAVFTEGNFRKKSRDAILNYWANWKG